MAEILRVVKVVERPGSERSLQQPIRQPCGYPVDNPEPGAYPQDIHRMWITLTYPQNAILASIIVDNWG